MKWLPGAVKYSYLAASCDVQTGRDVTKRTCPQSVETMIPASSWLACGGLGAEALREVVYRAILGALLYLNFCQCEN